MARPHFRGRRRHFINVERVIRKEIPHELLPEAVELFKGLERTREQGEANIKAERAQRIGRERGF